MRERQYLLFLEARPLDQLRGFILRSVAEGNPHMVALADDRVVGWCDIRRKAIEVQSHCGVLGMGVVTDFRGKGLGSRLLLAALAAARSAGLQRVELGAHANNARAISLYEKVGFRHEGVARASVKMDDRLVDSVNMAMIFE